MNLACFSENRRIQKFEFFGFETIKNDKLPIHKCTLLGPVTIYCLHFPQIQSIKLATYELSIVLIQIFSFPTMWVVDV